VRLRLPGVESESSETHQFPERGAASEPPLFLSRVEVAREGNFESSEVFRIQDLI